MHVNIEEYATKITIIRTRPKRSQAQPPNKPPIAEPKRVKLPKVPV